MTHKEYTEKRDAIINILVMEQQFVGELFFKNEIDEPQFDSKDSDLRDKAIQALDALFLKVVDTFSRYDKNIGHMSNTAKRTRGNRNQLRNELRLVIKGDSDE